MNKVLVLGCALAGALALTVGCNNSKPNTKQDEALKAYDNALADLDKQLEYLKGQVATAAGEEKTRLEQMYAASAPYREVASKKLAELKKAAADKWDALDKETKDAFEKLKSALPSRDATVRAYEAALADFDKRADVLKAKMEKASGEEKARLEASWKETTDKRAAAAKRLEELKKAAAEKWDAVEKEMKEALDALKKAIGD